MESLADLLVLSRIPNVGASRLRALVSHFADPGRALRSTAREISAVEGFSKKLSSQVAHFRGTPAHEEAQNYARLQLSKLATAGGSIVSYWDASYPASLKQIFDPPPFFFLRGTLLPEDNRSIGIVGTRSPTDYGTAAAGTFSRGLASLGITVVSGLARGIDTVAHGAALANGGRTLAVIGSGLDIIYPPENRNLSEQIARRGAVISEYEMGARPDAANFPKRNRIISGLTLGTLVIETDVNGGAMITATSALDQDREVFAVPGNIDRTRSRGCNLLIREGKAKLVDSVEDILVELKSRLVPAMLTSLRRELRDLPEMTLFEKHIYDNLTASPVDIDSLAEKVRSSTSDTLVHLLSLEFKGLVRQLPGKQFLRVHRDGDD